MIIESNFIKLRCFFGCHKWGCWVDSSNIKKISFSTFCSAYDVPTQTKTCSLCNIKKIRIVEG